MGWIIAAFLGGFILGICVAAGLMYSPDPNKRKGAP